VSGQSPSADRRPRAWLLVAALLLPSPALAQEAAERDPRTSGERLYYFLSDEGDRAAVSLLQTAPARLTDPLQTSGFAFVYYALPPRAVTDTYKAFLRFAERARVDQQLGAPSLGGSAGAASRTGLASVLGLALETGAVTQTVDQNAMTLRANADGLARFLSNQEIFTPCADGDAGCRASGFLKNLELSASFNVSESDTKTLSGVVPGTGDETAFSAAVSTKQLRSASARYAIYNSRDLRSAEYRERWVQWLRQNPNALAAAGTDLLRQFSALTDAIRTTDVPGRPEGDEITHYAEWTEGAEKALAAARASSNVTEEEYRRVYAEQLDRLIERMRALDAEFDVKLARLADAYARYLSSRRSLASALVTEPALTVEYNFAQPALQPKLHTVRVAYAFSPKRSDGGANPGTVTVNAGFGYYDDPQPTGTGFDTVRWRDVHLAVQFDRPLGPPDSAAQLSIGAYYQYQKHPNVIEIPLGATVLPGTSVPLPPAGAKLLGDAGSLVVGQALLTIRIPGSGLRMPLGFSWSNRTELATGNEVRGHVGFTFDPAPLFLMTGGS
jgi:hypothetical protein